MFNCPHTTISTKNPVIKHNELKETYFVIARATKNVTNPKTKNFQSKNTRENITPEDAAIPFPPLKFI